MKRLALPSLRWRRALRTLLSADVTNGLSVGLGLALISTLVHLGLDAAASASAITGVIVASPPDRPSPRRGKLRHLVIAPLLGVPLFLAVQLLRDAPFSLGALLVPATFVAFLAMAWGKRGIGIAIAVMLAMIFSLATPVAANAREALERSAHVALGAGLYVLYATFANLLLNARYRVQAVADLLLTFAGLLRSQAARYGTAGPDAASAEAAAASSAEVDGRVLQAQAALADQLQSARDLVFESPRTPRRQRLAAMLLVVLEMRDHLLATELDLDALRARAPEREALRQIGAVLRDMADDLERAADALLLFRTPPAVTDRRALLEAVRSQQDESARQASAPGPSAALLARGIANRCAHLNDEAIRVVALARGEVPPDLAVVRASWRLFVSPTDFSLRPFLKLWRWDAPPLRHAVRAALALGAGYVIALAIPWGSHDYWILLTIVVVLRGSLAQTLERRNQRVAGTLAGCVLAAALLAMHPATAALLLTITVAQAVSHAFAVRKYLYTAVGATLVGLLQAHMLYAPGSTTFALLERMGDTLIGAGIAWLASYVLPSWERTQLPALVRRTLVAEARHARLALGLGQLTSVDSSPELEWRLARREAYDALSALVQATQRSLAEPRAVRPPIEPLQHLQAHSYQLLAQLSAVKSMLLLRRERLTAAAIAQPLARVAARIDAVLAAPLTAAVAEASEADAPSLAAGAMPLLDPFDDDVSPWLLRRLDLCHGLALQLHGDAARVVQALDAPETAAA